MDAALQRGRRQVVAEGLPAILRIFERLGTCKMQAPAMVDDEVTRWIGELGRGDQQAAQAIFERYFDRLVFLARRHLEGLPRRAADEEDVALSAMDSFCRGVGDGRYPQLHDRHDLWRLLVTLTVHKSVDQARAVRARKRGAGRVRGESAFVSDDSSSRVGIEQVMGREPTPAFAAMVAENCTALLEALGDETLKKVALCKMEGYSNEEIASKLGYTTRTVERKLSRIRDKWQRGGGP